MPKATLWDWILLTRPWSVTAPLVPFLVGAGFVLGGAGGGPEAGGWLRWGMALASGIILVLACNLFNTWGDERSGVDRMPGAFLTTPQIQQGKISLRATFILGCVLFLLAGAVGLPTLFYRNLDGAWRFNWILLAGASIGFFGAVNYSTGVKYKYLGLGVPVVAFLQGTLYLVVVEALLQPTYFAHKVSWMFRSGCPECHDPLFETAFFLLYTLPVAALVGVILHGNDMRDIATDRMAGVRSLASAVGPKGALAIFAALHLYPHVQVALIAGSMMVWDGDCWSAWPLALPLLEFPLTARILVHAFRDWRANPAAPAWLDLEKGSGAIHFLFGVLYALGFAVLGWI